MRKRWLTTIVNKESFLDHVTKGNLGGQESMNIKGS